MSNRSKKSLEKGSVVALVLACIGVAVIILVPVLFLAPGPLPRSALFVAVFVFTPAPLIALCLGRSSHRKIKDSNDTLSGKGIATAAVILSVLQLCFVAIVVLSAFTYIGINWRS